MECDACATAAVEPHGVPLVPGRVERKQTSPVRVLDDEHDCTMASELAERFYVYAIPACPARTVAGS